MGLSLVEERENEFELKLKIVKKFADLGLQIHPAAFELLKEYINEHEYAFDNFDNLVKKITSLLDESVFLISSEHIKKFIGREEERKEVKGEKEGDGNHQDFKTTMLNPTPTIIKSFSSHDNKNNGDFFQIFRDRYERISGMIKKRINASPIRSINNLSSGNGEEFSVVGMVSLVKKTAKGNLLVELEDPTGFLQVIFQGKEEIIEDEIIGVTGYFSKKGLFIANSLTHPDVPLYTSKPSLPLSSSSKKNKEEQKSVSMQSTPMSTPIYVVFISDLHVGSKVFLEDAWHRFVQWINEKIEKEDNIASLVVAGDVVDGIGVYPSQETDLEIMDIAKQYEIAGNYFAEISSSIPIVIAPGNHDAVRGAEPQLPLPEKFARFFPPNTIFVSNPSYIKICNRLLLIYHGQSYDDFINSVSRLSYSNPEEVLVEMLRRRSIAPIYGKNVPIAPNNKYDYSIIDPIPDVLHCGHVHTVGISKYRNVLTLNSGCWQTQTKYQRKRNISPIPGCAILVELFTLKAKVIRFVG